MPSHKPRRKKCRVDAICQGGTRSGTFDRWIADPDVHARGMAAHPIGRVWGPAEQAEAASFLSSEKASYNTGVVLPVDGGLTVRCASGPGAVSGTLQVRSTDESLSSHPPGA